VGVEGGGDVEDDRNQGSDILDVGRLGVEVDDGGGHECVDVGKGRCRRYNVRRMRSQWWSRRMRRQR
jgi:hypothetical protein